VARRRIPTTDLTVRDVLAAPAEFAHEASVRTQGPAVLLVLEVDAPPRLEVLAGTRGEAASLQSFIRRDPLAGDVTATYFAFNGDDPVVYEREDRHAERLEAGRPLSSLRVSDGASR
jgi:hypothetical protein